MIQRYTINQTGVLKIMETSEELKIKIVIDEGVMSVWHYHYKEKDTFNSLCKKPLLGKSLPLSYRSTVDGEGHIPSSFCKDCDELFKKYS